MTCECNDKGHERQQCGNRASGRIWVDEIQAHKTICGDCRAYCEGWVEYLRDHVGCCDNCDASINREDDYLSDDRGLFCERCWCVGEPRRVAL